MAFGAIKNNTQNQKASLKNFGNGIGQGRMGTLTAGTGNSEHYGRNQSQGRRKGRGGGDGNRETDDDIVWSNFGAQVSNEHLKKSNLTNSTQNQ